MKTKKNTGSYYTPKNIAEFLVGYISNKLTNKFDISILEPSAGDGVFVKAIYNNSALSKKIVKLVAVEQSKQEINKIIANIENKSFKAINSDFLQFQNHNTSKFSIVIGNPPYIKLSLLKEKQIEFCQKIHRNANLSDTRPKNIWTAFLVRCIEFTAEDGILAFVLPAELLQVKYAQEIRNLIILQFERIEIFTFNELLFDDCKGQDTLLLIAEKKSVTKGVFYCNINKQSELELGKLKLIQNIKIRDSKWTYYHLEAEDIELLEKLKEKVRTTNDYCSSKAGIVTAANNFFIVNANTVEEYSLEKYIKPIIQKGLFVNGDVVLSQEDFKYLIEKSKPTFLIAVDNDSEIHNNNGFLKYIKIGEGKNLHKRYKMSSRSNWYEVPNIAEATEAFFFKRCYEYPKLIKNAANVLTTDSAYYISMRENYDIDSLIFSFYNSLTLSYAELNGRFYGGGVLELTPNEFKKISVPYIKVNQDDFNIYSSIFKAKKTIKEICSLYDRKIIKSIDNKLNDETIDRIFNIREKLYLRRIKN